MPDHPLARLFREHLEEIGRRTARALEASGFEGLLLHAGDALGVFLDDQQYPFKAHAPFRWWAPLLDAPGSLVHVRPGHAPRLVFRIETDFWYQPAALPEAWWPQAFEVVEARSPEAVRAALPANLGRAAWIGDDRPDLAGWGLAAVNPPGLLRRLDYQRARKTPYEIACLREANRIGMQGHRAAEACFRAGGSEYEIHQALAAGCGQREQELPYNAIVALDEAASVLHYQVLRRGRPAAPRTLLLDAGASFAGYGSDITRTHAFADGEFKALIGRMDEVQQGLCAMVRPGVDWRDIHLAAVERIAGVLHEVGVIRCSAEESLANGVARLFFPHGVGHLLGLQVHDVGGFMADETGGTLPKPPQDPALRLTRRLEPGFVVTMEPGLYFIEALLGPARGGPLARHIDWDRVGVLQPYGGIRIEDDLAVTAEGCENLTRGAVAPH
ncbi:MAG: Xaa-Pro dipeptidase [Gammaproteobacteria bacterium]|nr:Xaa-Pro dipeptidase [Gammaproteobacteria bacterium]